jgi:hypothetical protein
MGYPLPPDITARGSRLQFFFNKFYFYFIFKKILNYIFFQVGGLAILRWRGLSQIWLQIKERKVENFNHSSYILATCWNLEPVI